MASKKHILILEASTGGGHLSISDSIIEQLPSDYQITRYDVADNYWYKPFYQFTTRHTQKLYRLLYRLGNSQKQIQLARHIPYFNVDHRIRQLLKDITPDLIFINTPLINHSTTAILKESQQDIPTITFVADPFSIHTAFFNPDVSHTCVATQQAYRHAISENIPKSKLTITGHPVRKNFYQTPHNLQKHRISLKLQPNLTTILIGGSGDGADQTIPFINELLKEINANTPPIQLIFPTGTNKQLKNQLQQISFPTNITPHIIGHTNQIHDYLHAADLIIGKAGPNIIFESCATQTPIFAIYHIEGQETSNLDFIIKSNIGYVQENLHIAAKESIKIIQNPSQLQPFQSHLKKIAQQHQPAAQHIFQIISTHLN